MPPLSTAGWVVDAVPDHAPMAWVDEIEDRRADQISLRLAAEHLGAALVDVNDLVFDMDINRVGRELEKLPETAVRNTPVAVVFSVCGLSAEWSM